MTFVDGNRPYSLAVDGGAPERCQTPAVVADKVLHLVRAAKRDGRGVTVDIHPASGNVARVPRVYVQRASETDAEILASRWILDRLHVSPRGTFRVSLVADAGPHVPRPPVARQRRSRVKAPEVAP